VPQINDRLHLLTYITSDYVLQYSSNSASDGVLLLLVDRYPLGLCATILVNAYPNGLHTAILINSYPNGLLTTILIE